MLLQDFQQTLHLSLNYTNKGIDSLNQHFIGILQNFRSTSGNLGEFVIKIVQRLQMHTNEYK